MVALCEVENDSVLKDLTERSVLRNAGYRYLITHSPDLRGIDVALLYSPASFGLIRSYALRVRPLSGMRPTRDILYACGETVSGDTLHVFVVHAPSRFGGERQTRPNRRIVGERLMASIDSIRSLHPQPRIIVAGDFNDGDNDPLLKYFHSQRLHNISEGAMGHHGAKATYKYQGKWENIDHILVSSALVPAFQEVYVHDPDFLLEEDTQYGGKQPHRNYNGMRYQRGFSDHLPLVARFRF
jgi:endonuclease/exonuclease/phosphatase family metal-dependent hydrolase